MKYYWVIDFKQDKKGNFHPVVIGGRCFTTQASAQSYIDNSNLSNRAEIIPLDTCSQSKASGKIKAILIKRFKSLDKGLSNAYHK